MSRVLTINGAIIGVDPAENESFTMWSNILRDVRQQWAKAEEYGIPKGKTGENGNGGSIRLGEILHDVGLKWAEAEGRSPRAARRRR